MFEWYPLASIPDPDVSRAIGWGTRFETPSSKLIAMRSIITCKPVLQLRTDSTDLICGELDVAGHLKHAHMCRCALQN
jgi:hypothetical protein